MGIIIVHDSPVVRDGLRGYLEQHGGMEVVAEAGLKQRLEDALPEDIDVRVAIIYALPPYPEVRQRIRWFLRQRGIQVVVLGTFTERTAAELVHAGACALLPMNMEADELVRACIVAGAGGQLTNAWTKAAARHVPVVQKERPDADVLTDKQRQVLDGIRRGLSYKQIGEEMNIGWRGVRQHVQALYHKWNVHKQSALMDEARKRGLL